MRLATYNIWNSPERWPDRLPVLRAVLEDLNADLVAIQEAPVHVATGVSFEEYFSSRVYPYVCHFAYPIPDEGERPEGLAFLSKADFEDKSFNWAAGNDTRNSWTASVTACFGPFEVRVTNVHLDYRSASNRSASMVKAIKGLSAPVSLALDVLAGDFNGHPNSDVDRFLRGVTALDGYGTQWSDVADLAAESHARESPTLDFINNLRWTTKTVSEKPGRFDRIYVRPADGSTNVEHYALFGDGRNSASDHYGVVIDVTPDPS